MAGNSTIFTLYLTLSPPHLKSYNIKIMSISIYLGPLIYSEMIYRSFSASSTFSASVFLSSLKKVLIFLYLSLSCYVWCLCIFKAWTELIGIVYSLLDNEWVGPKIYIYITQLEPMRVRSRLLSLLRRFQHITFPSLTPTSHSAPNMSNIFIPLCFCRCSSTSWMNEEIHQFFHMLFWLESPTPYAIIFYLISIHSLYHTIGCFC